MNNERRGRPLKALVKVDENGNIVARYENIDKACEILNVCRRTLYNRLNSKRRYPDGTTLKYEVPNPGLPINKRYRKI